ncbi:MAG: hypothetical protein ACP5QK_02425 [Myxococcota bacterium]
MYRLIRRLIGIIFVMSLMYGCSCEMGGLKCRSDENCPTGMICGGDKVCIYPGGKDIGDVGMDVITDVCIPNCSGKECGDDGCGGSCGDCGSNASCNVNRCVCNSGYGNCDNMWSNGCETTLDPGHLWSKRFGGE